MSASGARGRPGGFAIAAVLTALLAVIAAAAAGRAHAGDRRPPPVNDTWRTECGACHVPYPPRRLPARSWDTVMRRLDRHFGADASLDPGPAAEVAAFLARHAGRDRGEPPVLRITETRWFRREHRDVPPAAWVRPAVKSPANCGACHPGAAAGRYDDETVRVPR